MKKKKNWAKELFRRGVISNVKDGLVLAYVKDGIVYPVAMTKDGYDMLQFMAPALNNGQPLKVIADKPMGKAIDLTVEKNNSK